MKTIWLLAARYDGVPVVPLETVVRDYFPHLSESHFLRKVAKGEIDLPLVRLEGSQKAPKGVALVDLAQYIDARIAEARAENDKMFNRR